MLMVATTCTAAMLLLAGRAAGLAPGPQPSAVRAAGLSASASPLAQAPPQPRVNTDARIMAEFEALVKEYSDLHRRLESTLAPLPKEASAQQIDTHQMALGQLIARSRSKARAGDIFTKEIRALFRRSLAGVFAGREGGRLKALVMDENPGKIRLPVNSRYPDAVPVTTMPAQVLEALPKLPEELEYRFIGDRLILFDVHAHTIVDLLDDAFPH